MSVDLEDKVCLGPAEVRKSQYFTVPEGAWDSHAHVIGAPPDFPYVRPRQFTPYPITVDDYLGVLDTVGFRHGVLVQISVHGTDNGYVLQALKGHRNRLKGVAVVDRNTPERDLATMKDAGIVGLRLLEAKGGVGVGDIEWFDHLCAELGLHMQMCVTSNRYRDILPKLRKLRTRLVIDHLGWFDIDETPAGPGFSAVVELLRDTDTWVKISGPFRLSREKSPYADTFPFVRKLFETAPGKLVWGSDWPHVAIFDASKMPKYGELLDWLWLAANGDKDLVTRILLDNPERLYGQG